MEATVKRKKFKSAHKWFVVIVGRPPGIYANYEVSAHIKGVPNVVYQGYPTRQTADLAWEAARLAGMIGSPEGLLPRDFTIKHLPIESATVPIASPLSGSGPARRFYVVYRGRHTGIFNSRLVRRSTSQ